MGCRLTIKGQDGVITFGEKIISSANVEIDSPLNTKAKASMVDITLEVSGYLNPPNAEFNDSDTLKLIEWAQYPAEKWEEDLYRDVTVEVINNDKIFRKINLTKAFIVSYSETSSETNGVGSFSMLLRQRVDMLDDFNATSNLGLEGEN